MNKNLSDVDLARLAPAGWARYASNKTWQFSDHLLLLNDYLLEVAAGRIKRLMVEIPPRHGKSELISKYLPGWYLGTFPDRRVILAAYEAEFASSWGRKARDTFAEHGQNVFNVQVSDTSAAADRWDIAKREGGMITAGVMGPITGKGANLFLMDDPIKNAKEALSEVQREHMWDWFQSTAYTRLEPDAAMILTMARWHEDDMAGRLIREMEQGGEKWTILRLPALAEQDDVLGRKEGEALWPWRYNADRLKIIRRAVGEFWWNALFQQRPLPAGGGIFKFQSFRYFKMGRGVFLLYEPNGDVSVIKTSDCWLFATVDLAVSTKDSADYTVVAVWAVTPDHDLLLLEIVREKLEHPDQVDVIKKIHAKYGHRLSSVDIETNQYQLALVQELLRTTGIPVEGVHADKDKLARALPAGTRIEAGKVYFKSDAPWLDDFTAELKVFTGNNDKHDDQVDTLSLAARRLAMGEGELEYWVSGESKDLSKLKPGEMST